ncbi:MAG: 4-alpha-glucanotransferase [Bacteroidales bacterium]|jgi:4-alpha-glucanotransferase|nr:4-alpha-glucanotransferase [Bacteroidales bacterium]NLM92139.1 4-alpha-glucanotransferase [Bacteroidales bacterium]
MKNERSSGILLHITSLPGPYGIGTMGREAFAFVDFLVASGQKIWQILPLGHTGYGDSPYQCFSAFAGNPLLIDLDKLMGEDLLEDKDLPHDQSFNQDVVDFGQVFTYKYSLLRKAYERFKVNNHIVRQMQFENFSRKTGFWLEDYAFFMALKNHFGGKAWSEWEMQVKTRDPETLDRYRQHLADDIGFYRFLQFLFYRQWQELKAYANLNDIKIIGDIPLYVAADSADAWSNPRIFNFNEELDPVTVAGVPPDYFSATGQLWGNPIYKWEVLEEDGFSWWIERVKANLVLYDIIRIDHFRGLAAYWAVPFGEETAILGEWIKAPGQELLEALYDALGDLPIIAEDLGVITPDVVELRDNFDLPGMKILQFAFDSGEENDFMPHTYIKNCVVYTGTHDNDTTLGQFKSLRESDRLFMKDYFGVDERDPAWSFVKLAWSTVANVAIAPLQDLLRLDTEARMNFPGKPSGYWKWRFRKEMLKPSHAEELLRITRLYGRR